MKNIIVLIIGLFVCANATSQEVLFTNYFDIKTNQPAGTFVIGKVNLKSNKDVDSNPIPNTYSYILDTGGTDIFEIETQFDTKGRIFGVLKVAPGKNSGSTQDYNLTVVLKDGNTVKAFKNIVVHVVSKTLWTQLKEHYTPITISQSRLYGRTKFSESELTSYITELENNNGQFSGFKFYTDHPSTFSSGKLESEWQDVSELIGGLGYAYANSNTHGIPSGNVPNMERLKRVIYKSVLQYMNNVPIYGNDVLVGGNPIGTQLGDGFSKMSEHGYISYSFLTHQWRAIDALGAPLLHIWPELLADIDNNDTEAQIVFDAVMRFHQLFFSIVPGLRDMNNDDGRWKNISDQNYSEGAWSDANLGHRMRTLMTMPILWADYNRPITYVPYWYDDYNEGTELEGTTFGHNWSPNGVLADLRHWCDRLSTSTYMYNQSGFHPDGTVTHHRSHDASDVAMFAYGYEWLVTANEAIDYFKDTPYPIQDESFQFLSDRLDYSYRKMLYKNSLDFLVTGRSFLSNLSNFGTKNVSKAISKLIAGKGTSTVITNETELLSLATNLNNGTHKHTESTSFWNADYLMHRNEEGANNYYFSVKNKSVRTSGAEDFSKVRKSWHAGSGPFLLRVDGNEYSQTVLENFDWHVVPGVTEEWRTDAMPTGAASDALPGGNIFSGILADGVYGMSAYNHKPIDTYTSAEAFKTYHLIGKFGTALGSNVKRKSTSSGINEIVTTIDQSKQLGTITYNINGITKTISNGASVNLIEPLTGPTWIHHNNKGYLVFPKTSQNLLIKTGSNINITATDLGLSQSINYILALDHGVNPSLGNKNGYNYVLVANVALGEMPAVLTTYAANTKSYISEGNFQAITNTTEEVKQVSFYKASRVNFDNNEFIEVDKPALVMTKKLEDALRLTIVDPLHDLNSSEMVVKISEVLKEDTYTYSLAGISPFVGETVVVTSNGTSESTITISLPNFGDGLLYNYQEKMYAGAPIVLTLATASPLSVDDFEEKKNSRVQVFPVPISNASIIQTSDNSFIQKVEIYNIYGQLIGVNYYKGSLTKLRLPVEQQLIDEKGVYVLRITTTSGTTTLKLI